ncbi:ComEA family DNA-binding protein [Agarivorans sp. QJM3NY_33]|uniref:ComEA family DNA-binding protein n=1 Tax=Agarivorans sp. QJM3NY_33 TaxID=3421432 RepID=UPI003D7E5902
MRLIQRLILIFCLASMNYVYAQETNQVLNLNTANSEQLVTLKGVGKSKSLAIIEYRQTHGNFKNIEQIVLVPGIGEKIYLDNKDKLYVE